MANEVVLTNHFPVIGLALGKAFAGQVEAIAKAIAAEAQANHPWQNETGFAESSVYVVTKSTSTYGQGMSGGTPETTLPEVAKPTDDQTAYVAAAASYAIYLEYGTVKMAAMPWFLPAAEAQRANLENPPDFEGKLRTAAGIP